MTIALANNSCGIRCDNSMSCIAVDKCEQKPPFTSFTSRLLHLVQKQRQFIKVRIKPLTCNETLHEDNQLGSNHSPSSEHALVPNTPPTATTFRLFTEKPPKCNYSDVQNTVERDFSTF